MTGKYFAGIISYNFDLESIVSPIFNTRDDAEKWIRESLDNEIKIVTEEAGYTPYAIEYTPSEIDLVYERKDTCQGADNRSLRIYDTAFYRVIELSMTGE